MEPDLDAMRAAGFAPLDFSPALWVAVMGAAALIRAIPLWLVIAGLLKARHDPQTRRRHLVQAAAAGLVVTLFAIDGLAHGLVPSAWRASGMWSFLWVFAVAWTALAWGQAARATGLRPRWIDTVTLTMIGLLILSLLAVLLLAR